MAELMSARQTVAGQRRDVKAIVFEPRALLGCRKQEFLLTTRASHRHVDVPVSWTHAVVLPANIGAFGRFVVKPYTPVPECAKKPWRHSPRVVASKEIDFVAHAGILPRARCSRTPARTCPAWAWLRRELDLRRATTPRFVSDAPNPACDSRQSAERSRCDDTPEWLWGEPNPSNERLVNRGDAQAHAAHRYHDEHRP